MRIWSTNPHFGQKPQNEIFGVPYLLRGSQNWKYDNFLYSSTADKATEEDYKFVCHQISFVGRTKLEALHAGKAQMQHLGNLGKARVNFHFLLFLLWLNFHNIAICMSYYEIECHELK